MATAGSNISDEIDVLGGVELIVSTIKEERDPERLLWEICGQALRIFNCDRAWLVFPCDPDAPSWSVPIERTVPEYPGANKQVSRVPMTPDAAAAFRNERDTGLPVVYGPGGLPLAEDTRRFQVKTQLSMAVFPRVGQPWQFGLHQCSYDRTWKPAEIQLFKIIGVMAAEALGNILLARDLQTEKENLERRVSTRTMELKSEKDFAESLIERAQAIVLVLDNDARIVRFNQYMQRISGYTLAEVQGRSWIDTFVPDSERAQIQEVFDTTLADSPNDGHINSIVTREGHLRILEWYCTALKDSGDRVMGVLAIGHDVSERVAAQERIRSSLKEKEVLLKEVHHRVKNNMQVILGLIRVQRVRLNASVDASVLEAFAETETRIKSMALVHERLYRSEDFSHINLPTYMEQLAEELLHTYATEPGRVELEMRVEDVSININQGIPCGLIVNELLSNALKYAFPEGGRGRIVVGFQSIGSGLHELSVRDDGVGLPEGFDIRSARSTGMAIVNALAGQLDAKLSVESGSGTGFRIRFVVD